MLASVLKRQEIDKLSDKKATEMPDIRISTPFPPELYEWLEDVYPVWLQTPLDAFYGLIPFNSVAAPLQLAYAENIDALGNSSIFRNLNIFLTLIAEEKILLDSDATMTSDSLDLLLTTTHWPKYDMEMVNRLQRPLHEETICPLDFLKALAFVTGLIELRNNRLAVTEFGHSLLEGRIDTVLVRKVFEATFAKVNPRTLTKLAHPWVHEQAGIIFWGLSVVGETPRSASELARYCFVPPKQFFDYRLKVLHTYMRVVFLQPLIWFSLIETVDVEADKTNPDGLLYRKTPLFDEFFKFSIDRSMPVERPN
ncbi:hypothetical protein [Pseudogemmobacter sp. W21_MBD1_M6]|uniref:hypothetical protein n=1 Tax=Pseudogemmobacter sp. W21_MBD1_M6 TaxID=3240271 RepID=UPI003F98D1D0